MGYMRHHAIIVSAYDETSEVAHARASAIFGELVTPIVESRVNSVRSFLVGPDGSKEHWDESDQGDRHRAEFVAWLRTQRDPAGFAAFDWVEVQYAGEDDNDTRIVIARLDPKAYRPPTTITAAPSDSCSRPRHRQASDALHRQPIVGLHRQATAPLHRQLNERGAEP